MVVRQGVRALKPRPHGLKVRGQPPRTPCILAHALPVALEILSICRDGVSVSTLLPANHIGRPPVQIDARYDVGAKVRDACASECVGDATLLLVLQDFVIDADHFNARRQQPPAGAELAIGSYRAAPYVYGDVIVELADADLVPFGDGECSSRAEY